MKRKNMKANMIKKDRNKISRGSSMKRVSDLTKGNSTTPSLNANEQPLSGSKIQYKEKPDAPGKINKILHPLVKRWFFSHFKEYSKTQPSLIP